MKTARERYSPLRHAGIIGLVCCLAAASAATPPAAETFPARDTLPASVQRGSIVYSHYCSLCHGSNADGEGRAAASHNPRPSNLRKSMMPDVYKALIISKGGKAIGRSEFMPPWGEELTDEQIKDVVNYLRSIAPATAAK